MDKNPEMNSQAFVISNTNIWIANHPALEDGACWVTSKSNWLISPREVASYAKLGHVQEHATNFS